MKNLLTKLARSLRAPERSPAYLKGWQDNADHGQNRNPHEPGTPEHADYESGYRQFSEWLETFV